MPRAWRGQTCPPLRLPSARKAARLPGRRLWGSAREEAGLGPLHRHTFLSGSAHPALFQGLRWPLQKGNKGRALIRFRV